MENEDEQLRYETEMAQMDLGLAIHGVSSSVGVLSHAIIRHGRYVSFSDIQNIREAAIALRTLLDLVDNRREAAE